MSKRVSTRSFDELEKERYFYHGVVLEVYDGDSITIELDLGLNISVSVKLRLADIDAPELRGKERPQGLVTRDRLREMILNSDVFVKTIKDRKGKYGRLIATVWAGDEVGVYYNVNDFLVKSGLAKPYLGRKKS